MGKCIFSYFSPTAAFQFFLTTYSQKKYLDEAKKFQAEPPHTGLMAWRKQSVT